MLIRKFISPFTERKQAASEIISCALGLVIWSLSDEMVGAVGEVQLRKVDQKPGNEADPECDPQGFAPQVAWNESRKQNVDKQEKHLVVAAKKIIIWPLKFEVRFVFVIRNLTGIGT